MFLLLQKLLSIILMDANNILLVKRNAHFDPAGGKIEINFEKRTAASLEQCAIREAQEELGITVAIEKYVGSYYFFGA